MDKNQIVEKYKSEVYRLVSSRRQFILIANWKMNPLKADVDAFVAGIKRMMQSGGHGATRLGICPPDLYLGMLGELRSTGIEIGVQNVALTQRGAYTGETAAEMAADMGCRYALIGHSERRRDQHETNQAVNEKVKQSLKAGLVPIVCIGENLQQRRDDLCLSVLKEQIKRAFLGLKEEDARKVILAYEPIWAIGTGETASYEQVEEAHCGIYDVLVQLYGREAALQMPILYGGSANEGNVQELGCAGHVAGFLVGNAGLKWESFWGIVRKLEGWA